MSDDDFSRDDACDGDDAETNSDASPGDNAVIHDSSLLAKEAERCRIQSEIDEFLSRGGTITQVDDNVLADPPRRPSTNYGGQPI